MNNSFDFCKFCHSNGESEAQYRSHQLKNSSGLVTCPVLRSFSCPICKATGDFAHTQRYCPLNKDGKFNTGASLTELKRKKNAAGNYPWKGMMWPLTSHSKVYSAYTGVTQSPPLLKKADSAPFSVKKTPDMLSHHPLTDPLPSCYRPPSPPSMIASQPPSAQLSLCRHHQYLQYYHHQQLHHEAEIARLQALRQAARVTIPPPCYVRNFPSPMSVTPPGSPVDKFLFPDVGRVDLGRKYEQGKGAITDGVKIEAVEEDFLGDMLAKLREGTEEMDT
eukprot:GFUD01043978.1.p1 GENE.GFUD01043978.1~~GFUD01043978.1.p1  ORF type:complete len:277 (+),score=78.17 GFUD01043978.1:341-1171(+)